MSIKRNDDIIAVDCVLYQFRQEGDCSDCAFDNESISFCKKVHCSKDSRIDQLEGYFKAI